METFMQIIQQFSSEKIIGATFVIIICIIFMGLINKGLIKYFNKSKHKYSDNTKALIRVIICLLFGLLFIGLMLKVLDITPSGTIFLLVFLLTAFSTAVKSIIDDVASGFVIKSKRPYELGDYIKVGDYEGEVTGISYNSTKIITDEGELVFIPSSVVVSDSLCVVHPNDTQMVIQVVPISSTIDPDIAISKLKDVIGDIPGVLPDEDCIVGISSLKNNIADYECIFYCRFKDKCDVIHDFNKAALNMLRDNYSPAAYPVTIYEQKRSVSTRTTKKNNS